MLTIPGTQPNTLVEFRRGPDRTIQTREIAAELPDSLVAQFEPLGNGFLPQLRRRCGSLVGRLASARLHPDATKTPRRCRNLLGPCFRSIKPASYLRSDRIWEPEQYEHILTSYSNPCYRGLQNIVTTLFVSRNTRWTSVPPRPNAGEGPGASGRAHSRGSRKHSEIRIQS